MKNDKAFGVIIGAAVGDALGAPLEFLTPRSPADFVKEMTGGGILEWKPGQITDDTMMAIAIMDMYLENGKYNQSTIIKKWVDWKHTNPKDIGRWTYNVLSKWARVSDFQIERRGIDNPAVQAWESQGKYDAGNGSVMRCMPSVIWNHNNFEQMQIDTIKLSEDTHPDPKCQIGCLLVNEAIYYMINGMSYVDAFDKVISSYPANLEIIREVSVAGEHPWNEWQNRGYVVDTVKCAFAALLQSSSFEEGLISVVNRGNDADTVGAVAGALLGARFGVQTIPERWRDILQYHDKLMSFVKASLNGE
jgi:ADP-ribosyl-[dinitrogen reductase] hydrolase